MSPSTGATSANPNASGTHAHRGPNLPGARQCTSNAEPRVLGLRIQQPSTTPSASPPTGATSADPNASTSTGQAHHPRHTDQTPEDPQTTLQQENNDLRACLARMEARQALSTPAHPFISDKDFEALRVQTSSLKEHEEQRTSVPAMVPGFKANLLTHVLTAAARQRAENSEHEMELRVDGTLAVKRLDQQDETSIREGAWQAASKLAVELAWEFWPQPEARENALMNHHDFVTNIADSHSWQVALAYDIRQREIMHCSPQHDISQFNEAVLSVVASCICTQSVFMASIAHPPPLLKRLAPINSHSALSTHTSARGLRRVAVFGVAPPVTCLRSASPRKRLLASPSQPSFLAGKVVTHSNQQTERPSASPSRSEVVPAGSVTPVITFTAAPSVEREGTVLAPADMGSDPR
ncbi:hypothetical protein M422DRAFT_257089 [Sphaerobolus stellatus SS14]|uniref:Uncharacterized protein n=1 Tax=Sphaerobolus stellatus (strain SS14) TaxID=990650 RepID=A0A0C9UA69_SPHS4|nr:hypothetical protein M422DRAFT_257089 [Sphaerobolus stellatus SS14]